MVRWFRGAGVLRKPGSMINSTCHTWDLWAAKGTFLSRRPVCVLFSVQPNWVPYTHPSGPHSPLSASRPSPAARVWYTQKGILSVCLWLLSTHHHPIFPPPRAWSCCRKGDPFQGPKLGSCLTLGNELLEETHVLTKQEISLGKDTWVESRRVREPRRTALHGFYGDGISFRVVFSQSFWLRVLPGGTRLVQPRWMLERRILGGGWTCGVSFWPFPNSFGWWRLIRSIRVPYQDLLS